MRPLGPAGWPIKNLSTSKRQIDVDGHAAVWASEDASYNIALDNDTISEVALAGVPPTGAQAGNSARSNDGNCSGALRFDLTLRGGEMKQLSFVCPALPERRAVGHRWDGTSPWAQLDLNKPNPSEGGLLQPDPGDEYWAGVKADDLFREAANYWSQFTERVKLQLPDPRWAESFAAILGHSALCMNNGAPDVAVVNYNVFNRDGTYMANIFQKSGHFDLAETAINYFLSHPFNGRVEPEADNPGEILWILGEHWKFTRDRAWLLRVYAAMQKLAAMIRYYRTTPEPHWVSDTSLEFGNALPENKRKQLKPGACDGLHPEYTEAYDIAGLRNVIPLAEATGNDADAKSWKRIADVLASEYNQKFSTNLAKGYGGYSVLWPCRLYPFERGVGHDQFQNIGAQQPTSWRYFPLARAHQGLLAGNRSAAFETLNIHLDHPQMRGWYAFDEGGDSGVGGWNHVRTTWRQGKASDAMPHGWAIAEFQLLLRDALMFEDGDKLVLFAGIPPQWFTNSAGMKIIDMPTHFGRCSLDYAVNGKAATLKFTGDAAPAGGFVLRLPPQKAKLTFEGNSVQPAENGDVLIPRTARQVELTFP